MPIAIPKGVDVAINGYKVKVKGPKGELFRELHPNITVKIADGSIIATRPNDSKQNRSFPF